MDRHAADYDRYHAGPDHSEAGVNIFGLINGRDIVAKDEEAKLLVTWNRSLTLQVWSEDGGWFTDVTSQSFMQVPTRDEAEHAASILLEGESGTRKSTRTASRGVMGIRVTVITLYDDSLTEHYVSVVHGTVSKEERLKLAKGLNAYLPDEVEDHEDQRILYFREVDTCDSPRDVDTMPNIDDRAQ